PSSPLLSTLSLHDALPICSQGLHHVAGNTLNKKRRTLHEILRVGVGEQFGVKQLLNFSRQLLVGEAGRRHERREDEILQSWIPRSEEHTSELQSRSDLVCR